MQIHDVQHQGSGRPEQLRDMGIDITAFKEYFHTSHSPSAIRRSD